MGGRVREQAFDLAVLFQNAFEAALIARLGGVPLRVGYNTDHRRFLLTHAVVRDRERPMSHEVEYYLSILRAVGWEAKSVDPAVYVAGRDEGDAGKLLLSKGVSEGDLVVGLSPGAIYGPAKRWPPERFAAVGDLAAERWGARVIILGSGTEKEVCDAVDGAMKGPSLNLCGATSLGAAMALIKRCGFFVTNDSGLMHVAAALDVPLVAVFGSTNATATGPRSRKARVVRHDLDCAPCKKSVCPRDFRCMLDIRTEEVWDAMEGLRAELEMEKSEISQNQRTQR
jgi:heptosyltransferase-2